MPRLRRSLLRRYRLFAPRLLRLGVVLLALLLLCDGIAALHVSQIQAALTLDAPGPSLYGAAASLNEPQTIVASDTFARTNQPHWGIASSGQSWLADAQTDSNFTVFHAAGVISAGPDCTYCEALLGPVLANVEVRFNAALSTYNGSALCAVLRWTDPNDFYQVVLDGQALTIVRVMDGMSTPLQHITFPARAGALYTLRFRADGARLFAMAWPAGQPAPANWQISAQDSAFNTGHAGLGVLLTSEAQANITMFREGAL